MKNRNQRIIGLGKSFGKFVKFFWYGIVLVFCVTSVGGFVLSLYDGQRNAKTRDLFDVCQGVAHTEYPPYDGKAGIHGAISFSSLGSLDLSFVPEEAAAKSKEAIELVVCNGEYETRDVFSCAYTLYGGTTPLGQLIRSIEEREIAVYEVATGKLVASERLSSSESSSFAQSPCPLNQEFPTGQDKVYKVLELPASEIQDWVRQYTVIE